MTSLLARIVGGVASRALDFLAPVPDRAPTPIDVAGDRHTPADGPVLIPGIDVHLAGNSSSADDAGSLAPAPTAEAQCPASGPFPRAGAGHPPVMTADEARKIGAAAFDGMRLNRDDLMDAARAVRAHEDRMHPALRPHWNELADRIETAAIYAQK